MLLLTFNTDIYIIQTENHTPINFYLLHPLYQDEAEFKLENGLEALIEKFSLLPENEEHLFIIDIERKNAVI